MKMFKAIAILTTFFVITTTAAQEKRWNQEPTSFRGIPWGASEYEAKKIVQKDPYAPFSCSQGGAATVGVEQICTAPFALGSAPIQANLTFSDQKFVYVSGSFKIDDYSLVKRAFMDKYGPPTSTEQSRVQTKIGATYDQEELKWVGPNIQISLQRFGSKITEGYFYVTTQEYWAARLKAFEERRSKLKDKL